MSSSALSLREETTGLRIAAAAPVIVGVALTSVFAPKPTGSHQAPMVNRYGAPHDVR